MDGLYHRGSSNFCYRQGLRVLASLSIGDGSIVDGGMPNDELGELKECENDNDYTYLLRHLCDNGFMPSGPFQEKGQDGDRDFDWEHNNMQRCKHTPPSANNMYA